MKKRMLCGLKLLVSTIFGLVAANAAAESKPDITANAIKISDTILKSPLQLDLVVGNSKDVSLNWNHQLPFGI
ncbi:hypothetical protein [Paenibacillus piri]|uniref:Uncharacterized protein n=1 Tax=Paenibacillus piri TaxID=2547395 RepID=A0A4R5KM53_9BACL|nr:hypothetical protein [Paenibacillus piri]TDF95958.1 hypothetical protein E1757_19780 [Paenibacillus piri]